MLRNFRNRQHSSGTIVDIFEQRNPTNDLPPMVLFIAAMAGKRP